MERAPCWPPAGLPGGRTGCRRGGVQGQQGCRVRLRLACESTARPWSPWLTGTRSRVAVALGRLRRASCPRPARRPSVSVPVPLARAAQRGGWKMRPRPPPPRVTLPGATPPPTHHPLGPPRHRTPWHTHANDFRPPPEVTRSRPCAPSSVATGYGHGSAPRTAVRDAGAPIGWPMARVRGRPVQR
ncbi:hypothetical protein GQ55_7G264800 [Panicum hallii var. hallii]|uniref:Uncharacterized protein n=1 Tax=Panicum hallii var. hallii TaxID=1504633 RepID=A0A2T7CZK4_9POAL|nr:hypothetical protein GQ55_7G264800 [Panicum hallii var. hallii]